VLVVLIHLLTETGRGNTNNQEGLSTVCPMANYIAADVSFEL
jgi:hypothetical protein